MSYQKHQTVTQLKKTYSALAQTTNKAIAEHGPIKTWDVEEETGNGETKVFVDKYVAPYLKIAKNCEYSKINECEFEIAYLNNKSNPYTVGSKMYKLVLNDGSAVYFRSYNQVRRYNGKDIPLKYVIFYIDVNGKKAPNVMGKDIFFYGYFVNWDLTPAGPDYKDYSGKMEPNGFDPTYGREDYKSMYCNKNEDGRTCAALIMVDGWQIKDDYPW